MRRFNAGIGLAAMVIALVTAPLYHSHDHDEHGGHALVHAHILEVHNTRVPHAEREIETPDDDHHHQARWIDFFTFQPTAAFFVVAVEAGEKLVIPVLEQREGVVLPSAPRAHSPPDARPSVPRSPPSI